MPSTKEKGKLVEVDPKSYSGSGSQLRKKSTRKSRRKKSKNKANRDMNLPSRLIRLLNYKAKRALNGAMPSARRGGKATSETVVGTRNGRDGGSSAVSGTTLSRICACSVHDRYLHVSHGHRSVNYKLVSSNQGVRKDDTQGQRLIPKEKLIALDCEMVGVGPQGRVSALGRCSIVDYDLNVVYDCYVKPELEILHYRTPWSGIHKHHMEGAVPFRNAQQQIANILQGKVLVGHSLKYDFQVLQLRHPSKDIRDTAMYRGLRELSGMGVGSSSGQQVGLKKLTKLLFGHFIQKGEHCSVEDAKATMNLYKLVETKWEEEMVSIFPSHDFKVSFMDDHFWPDDLDQ